MDAQGKTLNEMTDLDLLEELDLAVKDVQLLGRQVNIDRYNELRDEVRRRMQEKQEEIQKLEHRNWELGWAANPDGGMGA